MEASVEDRQLIAQQLDMLARCIATATRYASRFEAVANSAISGSDDATALATAGAFAYFVEMVSSCLTLIRERRLSATYMVSRAALLSLADLHNLRSDKNYPLHMDLGRLGQWTRFFDNATKYPNPLVASVAEEFDLAAEADRMRAEGVETGDAGGRALRDLERLSKAGFSDEQRSVYWLWSLHAHANLGAMWGAHVNPESNFTFRPKDRADAFLPDADGLIGMTLGAMFVAFPMVGIPVEEVTALRGELSRLRAEMGLNDGPG